MEAKGNLITADLVTQLRQAAADLSVDHRVKLVTIEGEGADFSFGASVPEHQAGQIDRVLPDFHALIIDWLNLPMPTAAMVRGRCLGGGFELVLACDFVFAASNATFGLPEIALGVFPPVGSVLLPQRISVSRASSAVLTGEARIAEEWRAFGLIEMIAHDHDLPKAVERCFERTLAPKSAAALRHAVDAVRSPIRDLAARELPRVERLYLDRLMRTDDAVEGIAAFMGKRAPVWKDR